jgi:hypothetical protein
MALRRRRVKRENGYKSLYLQIVNGVFGRFLDISLLKYLNKAKKMVVVCYFSSAFSCNSPFLKNKNPFHYGEPTIMELM